VSNNEKDMNTKNTKSIRLMIADDHGMVRRGLIAFLTNVPDIQIVCEAKDGREAVDYCEQFQPDVLLLDLIMPEMNGVEAAEIIRNNCPKTRIIALTSFQENDLVEEALRAGAISYLLKNISGEDLVEAIRAAYHGKSTLSPEVTQGVIISSQNPKMKYSLTTREKEVLHLMVDGLSNPEIAIRLTISRSTARAHVSNILAKLNVSKRTEAVSLALREKLVK
jgi:two-component system, NarL family, response regulator LiaR